MGLYTDAIGTSAMREEAKTIKNQEHDESSIASTASLPMSDNSDSDCFSQLENSSRSSKTLTTLSNSPCDNLKHSSEKMHAKRIPQRRPMDNVSTTSPVDVDETNDRGIYNVMNAPNNSSLAKIIVSAQEKSNVEQESTTTHEELERLLVTISSKEEIILESEQKIKQLQELLTEALNNDTSREIFPILAPEEMAEQISMMTDLVLQLEEEHAELHYHLQVAYAQPPMPTYTVVAATDDGRIQELESKVESMAAVEHLTQSLTDSMKQLVIEKSEFDVDKTKLVTQLEKAKQQLQLEQKKYTQLPAELEAAKGDYHESKRRVRELETALAQVEAARETTASEAQSSLDQRALLEARVSQLQSQIMQLTKNLHDAEAKAIKAKAGYAIVELPHKEENKSSVVSSIVAKKKQQKKKPKKLGQQDLSALSKKEKKTKELQKFDLDAYLQTNQKLLRKSSVRQYLVIVAFFVCIVIGAISRTAYASSSASSRPSLPTEIIKKLENARAEIKQLKNENEIVYADYTKFKHLYMNVIDENRSNSHASLATFENYKQTKNQMVDIMQRDYSLELRALRKKMQALKEKAISCENQLKNKSQEL